MYNSCSMSVSVPSALTAGWDLWESWLVPGLALVADMREKAQQHCCHPPVTSVFNVLALRASKICSQPLREVLEHRGCLWIICAMFFFCAATLCTCKRITEGISLTLSEIWVLPWHQPQPLRARQSLAVPSPGSCCAHGSNFSQNRKSRRSLPAGRWDLHLSGNNVLTWSELCPSHHISSAPTAQLSRDICQPAPGQVLQG